MVFRKKSLILTRREQEVLEKKLSGKKLTQQDSNYLSKFIRPKLREISSTNSKELLDKIEYNQKIQSIENKIKKIILNNLGNVESIILYGSAIQNNYKDYRDIDVLIVLREKTWNKINEKYKKIIKIKNLLKEDSVETDIELYDKKTIQKEYSSNPSWIYQLKDKKIIYGKLNLPDRQEVPKVALRTKIDYSLPEKDYSGEEIYKAIRNLVLVNLLIDKVVDNKILVQEICSFIGSNLLESLKENKESKIEKKIAFLHLKDLYNKTLERLNKAKWEKIRL
jgi:predicted nucleotidyltransferase